MTLLFALDRSRTLGAQVARHLHLALSAHEEREFADGEHKVRPLVSVRGAKVAVLHALYAEPGHSVHDKICRLLFFVGALRDAGADDITVITPYFAYARKDQRTKSRDPLTLRYMAQLLEAVGTDRMVTLDIHNPAALENAFRQPTTDLQAGTLLVPCVARYLAPTCDEGAGMMVAAPAQQRLQSQQGGQRFVVVSPDIGGIKRAEQFSTALAALIDAPVGQAFVEKYRSAGKVSGDLLVGNVKDHTAIIVDDMISSGTTLSRAINRLQDHGARRIVAAVTHGLFVEKAADVIASPYLERLFLTDSVPAFRLPASLRNDKLEIISAAPLLASVIGYSGHQQGTTDRHFENP